MIKEDVDFVIRCSFIIMKNIEKLDDGSDGGHDGVDVMDWLG